MKKRHSDNFFIFEFFLFFGVIKLIPEANLSLKFLLLIIQALLLYRFTFVLHDCAHLSLFKKKGINIIFGNIVSGLLFTTFSSFKKDHYNHHKYLWEEKDPQISDYSNVSFNQFAVYFHLIKPLFLLNLFSKIPKDFKSNLFFKKDILKKKRYDNQKFGQILITFIIQLNIFLILTSGGNVIWIFPAYLLFSISIILFLSRLRSYLEHGPLSISEKNKTIIRSHRPGFLGRIFLSNLWFSYHNEHHERPSYPSYKLNKLNKKNYYKNERPSSSYFASLLKLIINLTSPSKLSKNSFPKKPLIQKEKVNCGFCNSDSYESFSESRDYEYESSSDLWEFVRCKNCKNVYLNPRPLENEISKIYPSDYYSYDYKKISFISRTLKKILDKRRISQIIKNSSKNFNGNYLDIGCGDGRYLKLIKSYGFESESIFGTEISHETVENLNSKGFNVSLTSPETLEHLPNNKFSIITMFSVLEHVSNPYKVLKRCYELLEKDGVLVFEVPNIDSTNAWIFQDNFWGGYHTPRHWNLFNKDTVMLAASEIGYKMKSFQRSTGHAFWLWSLHHFVKYKLGLKTIGNLLNPITCWPIVIPITLVDFLRVKNDRETDNMIITLTK